MRAKRRLTITVLLATTLSGCATVGAGPPSLTQLNLVDQYSASSASTASPDEAGLNRCWAWLDDSMLADLADRAGSGSAEPSAAETRAAIARRYIELRARQARVANARAYLDAQVDNLEIARFREEAGLVSARDAVQAEAERARIAATIPQLEAENAADAARIAVLSGQAPIGLRDQLTPPGPIPIEPAELAVGKPSELLSRRADLRKAATRWQASSLLPWRAGQTVADYKQSVVTALGDVEEAQSTFDGAVAGARSLAEAAEKAEAHTLLARQQYRDGLADYDALSGAETALLTARDALAQARAARAIASIDLCVALGGGRGATVATSGG